MKTKKLIINLGFFVLAILIFTKVSFPLNLFLFLILTISLVLYRLFFTEMGKITLQMIKMKVEYFKNIKKIKDRRKNG